MAKNKYYAIIKGHKPGIYEEWYGQNGAEIQISDFSGAVYKSFNTFSEAEQWYKRGCEAYVENTPKQLKLIAPSEQTTISDNKNACKLPQVIIYTDGACIKNPGPGGYGIVLMYGEQREELSGGFRLTTNNRMEIMAAIIGLKTLKTNTTTRH